VLLRIRRAEAAADELWRDLDASVTAANGGLCGPVATTDELLARSRARVDVGRKKKGRKRDRRKLQRRKKHGVQANEMFEIKE